MYFQSISSSTHLISGHSSTKQSRKPREQKKKKEYNIRKGHREKDVV